MNLHEKHRKKVYQLMFVDSAHVGDILTRRIMIGCIIHVNAIVTNWYSKKPTVGILVIGTEFVVIKQGIHVMMCIKYNYQMMALSMFHPHMLTVTGCWSSIKWQSMRQL